MSEANFFSYEDEQWLRKQLSSIFPSMPTDSPELCEINSGVVTHFTLQREVHAMLFPVLERLIARAHHNDQKLIIRKARKACRNIPAMEDHISQCAQCKQLIAGLSQYLIKTFSLSTDQPY